MLAMNRLGISSLVILISFSASLLDVAPADARLFEHKDTKQKTATKHGSKKKKKGGTADSGTTKAKQATPPNGGDSSASNVSSDATADDTPDAPIGPLVTPPNSIDLTTAKFGRLNIELTDARFLEASVKSLKLAAENMDMAQGVLDNLSVEAIEGSFQDFTVDSMRVWTKGPLNFDTAKLLNDKILQFHEPEMAHARVSVKQSSLNQFLNTPKVLDRLSGSAKKRVPILSTLARRDVNFGFSFLNGDVKLQSGNKVQLVMDSKLGMGKVGVPVKLSAETKLQLTDGWVNFTETHLLTGGAAVPKDMAEKIVNRINSLSKWGTQSDDIKFQFTDLTVTPDDRLELEGTALITRLRFVRNQEDKIGPHQVAPTQPTAPTPQGDATPSDPEPRK